MNTVEDETDASLIAQIKLNGEDTVFKLDTGQKCLHCHRLHGKTWESTYVTESQKALYGPSLTPLKVISRFQGKLECEGKETIQSIYVVAHLK